MKRRHHFLDDGGRTARYFFGGEWPVHLIGGVLTPLECRVMHNEYERRTQNGIDLDLSWKQVDQRYGGHSAPMPDLKAMDGTEAKKMFGGRWPIDPTTESLKTEKLVVVCIEYARRRVQNIPAEMSWSELPAFLEKRNSSRRKNTSHALPPIPAKKAKVAAKAIDDEPMLPAQQRPQIPNRRRRSQAVRKSRVRGTPGTAAYRKNCARAAAHKARMRKEAGTIAIELRERKQHRNLKAAAAADRRLLADSVPELVMNLPDFADALALLVKRYVQNIVGNEDAHGDRM